MSSVILCDRIEHVTSDDTQSRIQFRQTTCGPLPPRTLPKILMMPHILQNNSHMIDARLELEPCVIDHRLLWLGEHRFESLTTALAFEAIPMGIFLLWYVNQPILKKKHLS